MSNLLFIGAIILLILLVLIFVTSYVKAPPSVAFIISGLSKEPRILIGKGGFRIPFIERLDRLYIGQISVDIKTDTSVPTNDFISVNVDAISKVRVISKPEGIRLAAQNFLNMRPQDIENQLKASLIGNMREVVGAMDLKSLNTDRDKFSNEIMKKALPDMNKLGIEIISCNIQNITDEENLIKDLGADNSTAIKKTAAIKRFEATRDIETAEAEAKKVANEAKAKSETSIAEVNNELEIKKANLKVESDKAKAIADSAYEIEIKEQDKNKKLKIVEADIIQKQQEQILYSEAIKVKESQLDAEVKKTADAEKYKRLVEGECQYEIDKLNADTKKYQSVVEAEIRKIEAETKKYEMCQEAEAILKKGEAEAEVIYKKGKAEADSILQKAQAMKEYGNASIIEMITNILPEVTKNVSDSLRSISSVNLYSNNSQDISSVTKNIPIVVKEAMDTIGTVTGVDLSSIIAASTKEAKTDKNLKIEGAIPVQEVKNE